MRNTLLLLACLITTPILAIDAYFNHAIFFDPDQGSYVETQMLFRGESLEFVNVGADGYQSRVELTYIFEQDGVVKDFSKNLVKSPVISDSLNALVDFLDVQRFNLPPGDYKLSIKLKDANNPSDTGEVLHQISIAELTDDAFFSSILFLDTVYEGSGTSTMLTRGNLEMVPRISGYQGPDRKNMKIYAELYQSEITLGGEKDFLVTYDIVDTRREKPIDAYRKLMRFKGNEVQPILQTWEIGDLPTGNYLVRLEARDRFNKVIAAQSAIMQRQNFVPESDSMTTVDLQNTFVGKIKREDSLRNMIYCMRYKAELQEQKFIENNWQEGDTTELRRFMYNFWRDRNPLNPELEWKRYERKIAYVDDQFGLGSRRRHACATDRGRVYLYYGKPDTRVQQPREPNAMPYEIWHYYALPQKQDAKFAFMDPSLVTNDYVMINSNVPGEMTDYSWYLRLSTPQYDASGNDEVISNNRVSDFNNLRGQEMNTVGSQALDFWNNPR